MKSERRQIERGDRGKLASTWIVATKANAGVQFKLNAKRTKEGKRSEKSEKRKKRKERP